MKRRLFALLACLALLLTCVPVSLPAVAADSESVTILPIDELAGRDDFIRGVDVSSLYIVTEKGGRFTDVDGSRLDNDEITNCLKILKKHGVNWIRLRIWVDPSDDKGSGGLNDLAVDLEIAKRAKALGLKFLLNFHYSDTWADPGNQQIPRSWVDVSDARWAELKAMNQDDYRAAMWELLTVEDLAEKVYDYTDSTLKAFAAAGCSPDMVQVGNETNGGMLDPIGMGIDNFAVLAEAGLQAVEANDPNNSIRTMIHLANGGYNDLYIHMIGGLVERNVDFDVIGLSYYPFWHGPVEDFLANMNDISARYDKDVVCAETSYGYTLEGFSYPNGTGAANIFNQDLAYEAGFPATLQGQADAVRQTFEAVAQVNNNRGLGAFYWEPAWIPTPRSGSGWAAGGSWASWANQAVFSYEGQALPSIDVFNRILYQNNTGADKSELTTLIDRADACVESDYTASSFAPLQKALKNAKEVRFNADATQAVVDAAEEALLAALNGLVERPLDKAALILAIARAQLLSTGGYTAQSWQTMQEALATAKAVRDNTSVRQNSIDAAEKALTAAINGLVYESLGLGTGYANTAGTKLPAALDGWTRYEAEEAEIHGSSRNDNGVYGNEGGDFFSGGYAAGGFYGNSVYTVDTIDFDEQNIPYVKFTVRSQIAGTTPMTIGFNGSDNWGALVLRVNDGANFKVTLPDSTGTQWDQMATVTINVMLQQGENEIYISRSIWDSESSSEGPWRNIDFIDVQDLGSSNARYESENGELSSGGQAVEDDGYSGGAYINGMMSIQEIGSASDIAADWSNVPYVKYTVNATKAGEHTLNIAYSAVASSLPVYVRVGNTNASAWKSVSLAGGDAWNDVVVQSCTVTLQAGQNEIWVSGATRAGDDQWINYDYIEVFSSQANGTVDRDDLEEVIAAVKSMKQGNVTDRSWQTLQEVLQYAEDVLEDARAGQEQVDIAEQALRDAVASLETATAITGATVRLEAEKATLSTGAGKSENAAFSGGGFVNGLSVTGGVINVQDDWSNVRFVKYVVKAATAGTYQLTIAYTATSAVPVLIRQNRDTFDKWQTLTLSACSAWDKVNTATCTVELKKGDNEIWVSGSLTSDWVNYDYIELTGQNVRLLGDVNDDGSVDSKDARMVLQHTVGSVTLDAASLAVANMNGDGAVDSKDARAILQFAVSQ